MWTAVTGIPGSGKSTLIKHLQPEGDHFTFGQHKALYKSLSMMGPRLAGYSVRAAEYMRRDLDVLNNTPNIVTEGSWCDFYAQGLARGMHPQDLDVLLDSKKLRVPDCHIHIVCDPLEARERSKESVHGHMIHTHLPHLDQSYTEVLRQYTTGHELMLIPSGDIELMVDHAKTYLKVMKPHLQGLSFTRKLECIELR